jgi:hypothetical protein
MEPVLILGFDPIWPNEQLRTLLIALGCPESRLKDAKWVYPKDQKTDNRVFIMASIQNADAKATLGKAKVCNTHFKIFLHSKVNRKVRIGPTVFNSPTAAQAGGVAISDVDPKHGGPKLEGRYAMPYRVPP